VDDIMERLSTLDDSFLDMEAPEIPMHVVGFGIFTPPVLR
jgi:hypothetical protein